MSFLTSIEIYGKIKIQLLNWTILKNYFFYFYLPPSITSEAPKKDPTSREAPKYINKNPVTKVEKTPRCCGGLQSNSRVNVVRWSRVNVRLMVMAESSKLTQTDWHISLAA